MQTLTLAAGALILSASGDAATLTFNQPARRNALSAAMWSALPEAVAAAEAEASVKLLVVRGAGGHFAAGADISEFERVYATRASSADYARAVTAGVEALAGMSKPSLARIEGACIGGGMAVALACDLRLAADDARLGITPARLGLMYSLADTKRLVDAVGPSAAKSLLFTGRIIDAAEGAAIGLVDAVHTPDALDEAVATAAGRITSASQWSVRKTKAVIRMILNGAADDTDETRAWFLDAVEGPDFHEGREAFMAKRSPAFPFR